MRWRRFVVTVAGVCTTSALLHHAGGPRPAPDEPLRLTGSPAHVALVGSPAGWRAEDTATGMRGAEVIGVDYTFFPAPGNASDTVYEVCLSAASDPAYCPSAGSGLVREVVGGDGSYRLTVQRLASGAAGSGAAADRALRSRLAVHAG